MTGSDYSEDIPRQAGYYVYRLWADDACLYVGRVGNNGPRQITARIGEHRKDRPWWPEVTRIDVATFSRHEDIVTEELAQIRELDPAHNAQGRRRARRVRTPPAKTYEERRLEACAQDDCDELAVHPRAGLCAPHYAERRSRRELERLRRRGRQRWRDNAAYRAVEAQRDSQRDRRNRRQRIRSPAAQGGPTLF